MNLGKTTALLAGVLFSCTGDMGGCANFRPLPDARRFEGDTLKHSAVLHLTDGGFQTLNANAEALLTQWVPNQRLEIPLPCTIQGFSLLGDVALADQGAAGCTDESCGRLDGKCDARDVPVSIPVEMDNLVIRPLAPDQLAFGVDVSIQTGKIMMDTVSRNHATCLFQNPAKCSIDIDSSRSGATQNRLQAHLRFTLDTRWNDLTSFEISEVLGTQLCGVPGAALAPLCVDSGDIVVASEGPCQTCNAGNWTLVKSTVLALVGTQVKNVLQGALGGATCQGCAQGEACPTWKGSTSACNADAGVSQDSVTGRCVPRALGLEGQVESAGQPNLEVLFALGGGVKAEPGLTMGFQAGAREQETSSCVPRVAPPPVVQPSPPQFEKEALAPFDLGFSLSSLVLNRFSHHAHQAGSMCSEISTRQVGVLNSGMFTPVLPSLKLLTTRGDEAVPMMLVFRPLTPPRLRIGQGTLFQQSAASPLLTLDVEDLDLDFYAQVEERQVRLFTLRASLSLPLSVDVNGCTDVAVTLGDLSQAIASLKSYHSEMLAEDMDEVAGLLKGFLSLAEPAFAGSLGAFPLPRWENFQLQVTEVKGLGKASAQAGFEHLGLFLKLLPSQAPCTGAPPVTRAMLKAAPGPLPQLLVSSDGALEGFEASVRVNGGLWSGFRKVSNGEYAVSHPSLVFQGQHLLEVRTRAPKGASLPSAPVSVTYTVDLEPPVLTLVPNPQRTSLEPRAFDAVTPRERLQFSWRLGEGPWTDFGPPRPFDLAEVEQAGGLEVRVRDGAQRETRASWLVPKAHLREDAASPQAQGCASTSSSLSWLSLGLLGAGLFRRRRT